MAGNIVPKGVWTVQTLKGTADNESLTGQGVDMAGYRGVVFIGFAVAGQAGTITLKAQQDSDSAYGTAADLLGTSVSAVSGTATTAHAIALLEIVNPQERYVRPVLAVPNIDPLAAGVIAFAYGPDVLPADNTYDEIHVGPAEGTA